MVCDKCKDVHEAQKAGLTQLPCLCSCHPTHICPSYPLCPSYPIYPLYPTNPYWITGTWTNDNTLVSPTACCQTPLNYTFTCSTNNHTTCGSGCDHKNK